MVTLPPQNPPFSARESHQARQIAESFGSDAERYDRTRPRYPRAMADAIMAASPGTDLLDVGIGTGISAAAFRPLGCRILGVEADVRMAEFARQQGFEVEVSTFENWDPAGRRFDLVTAGQAWHWVDPVAGAARAASILRPSGRLAVFWNVFEPPAELGAALAAVYGRVLPDTPFSGGTSGGMPAYSRLSSKAADGIAECGAFDEPDQWQFAWERSYTTAEWLDVVPTSGGHNLFPPGKLEELLDGLGTAVDADGGSFVMSYTTVVVTASVSD